jgi:hypothetical protein
MLTRTDLQRPGCGQCIKSRLACGGSQYLVFIVYDMGRSRNDLRMEAGDNFIQVAMRRKSQNYTSKSFDVLSSLRPSREALFTAFTRCNLLSKNGHIVVPDHVDRSITTQCSLALPTLILESSIVI